MPRRIHVLLIGLAVVIAAFLTSCGEDDGGKAAGPSSKPSPAKALRIVSGSENKALEPIIRTFAGKNDVQISVTYMGSVDMMLMLAEKGANIPYDAVWPANSLWIALGDKQKVVKNAESILRSPVVLGLKKSVAQKLGWIGTDVAISDILDAAESGRLRFAMTSATQSNSGASTYFGFLHAMAGRPDVLLDEHLQNPKVQENVRRLLNRVDRSSGSSGWLKDTVVNHYNRFQAMFNYEALIIEANRELVKNGKEPLYAVYPTDGIMISNSPLGYVDKKDPGKAELFKMLQDHLLSEPVQQKILAMGRRTGLLGLNPDAVDKAVFNPDWGIDVARIISPVPLPGEPVIQKALDLYQIALRKPSCTAYVVDVSGSMKGRGITDLKAALSTLFDADQARRYMLQPSPKDIHIIIPFNSGPLEGVKAVGNSPETMEQLLAFVQNLAPGGGTNIYSAAAAGLQLVSEVKPLEDYFPAVILMTDGVSKSGIQELQATMNKLPMGHDIPIHSITFGKADEKQLKEISGITIGRLFHGKDLIQAFRHARGYN